MATKKSKTKKTKTQAEEVSDVLAGVMGSMEAMQEIGLRDRFAEAAMTQLMATRDKESIDSIADDAYRIASAMLKVRAQQ